LPEPLITSPHNPKLKDLRRLARRREDGRFVAEGEDLLAAAEAAGWPALERYVAAGSGLEGEEVDPHVLAGVSGLGSGTRAMAVYEQRWADAPPAPAVVLWGVRDPGNVGTVLRSALAFGAACVVVGPGTADPFSPKAVRASMGAVFAVPLARVTTLDELPRPTVALAARAGEPLAAVAGERPGALLVGGEREGLPADVLAACDAVAHIPIAAESLNAAMAASIALYEFSRVQRA
jgi:TrmH family RNA methyltransferase